jgi:hypothetical protein
VCLESSIKMLQNSLETLYLNIRSVCISIIYLDYDVSIALQLFFSKVRNKKKYWAGVDFLICVNCKLFMIIWVYIKGNAKCISRSMFNSHVMYVNICLKSKSF